MKTRICLILVLLSAISFSAIGQETNRGTISVIGSSSGKYMPDIIRLSLTIRTESPTQKDAILQTDIQFDKMIKKLIEIGINVKDIKMKENNFGKKYDCDINAVPSYYAYKRVIVDIPMDKEKFINLSDSISNFNIPELIFTYTFIISDAYEQIIQKELIQKAVDNAFEIAEIIAKQKNIKIGDIISIDYGDRYSSRDYPLEMDDDFSISTSRVTNDSNIASEISFREIKVNESIFIEVAIKNK
jgi:uncharacterized protein YggE